MRAQLKLFNYQLRNCLGSYNIIYQYRTLRTNNIVEPIMSEPVKRKLEEPSEHQHTAKTVKISNDAPVKVSNINLTHGKGRPVSDRVLKNLSKEDLELLENVKSSCADVEKIKAAIQLRIKHRLCVRLPEDMEDTTYYIEDGLRRVYPYQYIYQSYAKRRWLGQKLSDVIKGEFRDITEEQLRWRFASERILVNGEKADYNHILKDNDSIANRVHRHELPVLATPIKVLHKDRDTLVVDKPPSVPIHPCGRFRHNSVLTILKRELNLNDIRIVHRLDRLVSGVLIIALNVNRARYLENLIKNRDVQKEYVCRVEGEFPLGPEEDDGEIIVDQPLEVIQGKIGITVVLKGGKESLTTFKRLNYNGKTSAVLCKPKTGRMHQIRVHLQYLGHPIVNDGLYNCSAFGPKKGKDGDYGKSLKQLSDEVIAKHRADCWLMSDNEDREIGSTSETRQDDKVVEFVNELEKEETMAAIQHFFTNESWKDLEQKWKFDPDRIINDPDCKDCQEKFYDPPKRSLFLYLHALKYSGSGWSYESELPAWARDTWKY